MYLTLLQWLWDYFRLQLSSSIEGKSNIWNDLFLFHRIPIQLQYYTRKTIRPELWIVTEIDSIQLTNLSTNTEGHRFKEVTQQPPQLLQRQRHNLQQQLRQHIRKTGQRKWCSFSTNLNFLFSFRILIMLQKSSIHLADKSMGTMFSHMRWWLSCSQRSMRQRIDQSIGWWSLLRWWKAREYYKLCATTLSEMANWGLGPGKYLFI